MRQIKKRTKTTKHRRPAQNNVVFYRKFRNYLLVIFLILLIIGISYHYRNWLQHYLSFKSDKLFFEKSTEKHNTDIRNYRVLEENNNKAIGIDISEYQGKIKWDFVSNIENKYPVNFVFVRATVGDNRIDTQFDVNWISVYNKKIIRGAYHYYRPDENSLEQAKIFIRTVTLKKGDLPPVVDIEKLPKGQSLYRLKIGLRRWLQAIEAHYKVKPIIYTGEKYYDDFLKEDFPDYLFWIANYNFYCKNIKSDWLFWQFTEKASATGINGNVDVNIFNGDVEQLKFITIE
jgi:lysozyme